MRYLAIDFGAKRLGLAVSDETGKMATPYATRQRQGTRRDIQDILATLRGLNASAIVLGLPRHTEAGQSGDSEMAARKFGAALEEALRAAGLNVPLFWWDERFSTREALQQLKMGGVSQKRAREDSGGGSLDARAAANILQGFLDRQQNEASRAESGTADSGIAESGIAESGTVETEKI